MAVPCGVCYPPQPDVECLCGGPAAKVLHLADGVSRMLPSLAGGVGDESRGGAVARVCVRERLDTCRPPCLHSIAAASTRQLKALTPGSPTSPPPGSSSPRSITCGKEMHGLLERTNCTEGTGWQERGPQKRQWLEVPFSPGESDGRNDPCTLKRRERMKGMFEGQDMGMPRLVEDLHEPLLALFESPLARFD